MKRIVLAAFACSFLFLGCDEEKKKAEILAKTASTEAGATETATTAAVTPPPSASVPPEPAKKEAICPTGPDLELTDKDLEAELRLKLAKPKDPIRVSDLANVKSLNLTKK